MVPVLAFNIAIWVEEPQEMQFERVFFSNYAVSQILRGGAKAFEVIGTALPMVSGSAIGPV